MLRRVSWTNIAAVLLALYLGAYCGVSGQEGPTVGPVYDVPPGAFRIRPVPGFYRQWHAEAIDCAGVTGYFDDIEWWAVPGGDGFWIYGHGPYAGYYDRTPEPDRIYIIAHDQENEGLVKHEALHQRADTVGVHQSPPYGACAPPYYDNQPWRR